MERFDRHFAHAAETLRTARSLWITDKDKVADRDDLAFETGRALQEAQVDALLAVAAALATLATERRRPWGRLRRRLSMGLRS